VNRHTKAVDQGFRLIDAGRMREIEVEIFRRVIMEEITDEEYVG